ncbi:MAG TPA: YncE family protein, partial [bacterium]|nr:YncE family protein [bacterium]
ILRTVKLPDEGGWDYLKVDADARRLYITHETEVLVLDADTYKVIGKVEGIQGAHGVALVPELGKGFVTSGKSGTVVVFDLKSLQKISEIKAQKDADAIVYDAATTQVFTFNGDSENSTVINAVTGQVVKTLDLGGKPEFAAVDGHGHLFNNLEDKSLVLDIDTRKLEIKHRWPLAPGETPSGMAMDVEDNRLFIGCRNKLLAVVNATNGKVIQTLPIGDHIDATYFDQARGTVFNSCGDGTLSVVHQNLPDRYEVVENAKTAPGARTMAFDSKTGHVFLVTADMEPAPTPTQDNPKSRRKIVPGTFKLLVLGQ